MTEMWESVGSISCLVIMSAYIVRKSTRVNVKGSGHMVVGCEASRLLGD